MSNGQDISLQGAYRQDQDAKLEVKPTVGTPYDPEVGRYLQYAIGLAGVVGLIWGIPKIIEYRKDGTKDDPRRKNKK